MGLCRAAGIEQIDAGLKGAVIAFRNKSFANPDGSSPSSARRWRATCSTHRLIGKPPNVRLAGARDLLKRPSRSRKR